jgi:hypothetical protein
LGCGCACQNEPDGNDADRQGGCKWASSIRCSSL